MLSPLHPLQLAFGLTLWAVWFVLVYSVIGVACGSLGQRDHLPVNLGLVGFTVLVGGYLLWCAHRCRQHGRQLQARDQRDGLQVVDGRPYPAVFMATMAFGVNLLAGLATLLGGVPFLLFAPCLR